MPAEQDERPGALPGLFRAEPLPRWRAVFAIVCAAAAFLSAGGMLEYGTGSPETRGAVAAGYWALVFAVHVAAFGGAGLLAAFPRLARRPGKLVWLSIVIALYAAAFWTWLGHQAGDDTLAAWLGRSTAYVPAAIVTLIGLALPARA